MLGLSPIVVLAADYSLPLVSLLFLPLFAIHRGGRAAIAKEHQAVHDALTGLPNRVLFRDRVEQAIHSGRRTGQGCSVMLMDLNHFKEINDTLGHHQGDRLLQEVGRAAAHRRCARATRSPAWAATSSASCCTAIADRAGRDRRARTCWTACASRSRSTRRRCRSAARIGVACHPEHGDDVETLIQRADIAMYAAKATSSGYAVFDVQPGPPQPAPARDRRRAARRDRALRAACSPTSRRPTCAPGGSSASRRSRAGSIPSFGVLEPDEFVPIAEQTGLIIALTSAVLDAALERVAAWRALGHDITVAVNLSARSFLDARPARDEIPALLAERDVPPEALELEITESMLMQDPLRARATLERLAAIGVGVAVDDFGTGYSSLAHLKRLPVDTLKIDKSFVLDMDDDEADEAIVRSMIELAHNLGTARRRRGRRVGRRTWMRLRARWAATSRRASTSPGRFPRAALLALLEAERDVAAAPSGALTAPLR